MLHLVVFIRLTLYILLMDSQAPQVCYSLCVCVRERERGRSENGSNCLWRDKLFFE